MYILTPENRPVDINLVPDQTTEDLRYSVLDISNPDDIDFFFLPLVFLENFNSPAVVLQIGENIIQMPCIEPPHDWKILIGEPELGTLEAISLEDINSRDFSALTLNPISSFRPSYQPIRIIDTFPDIRWYIPSLQPNYILTVPINNKEKPDCVYFVNGVTGRRLDSLDISDII